MAMLAAVAAVSGVVMMFSLSSPAQGAVHGACVGTANAHLDNTFFYPVNSTTLGIPLSPRSAGFTMHLNGTVAACVTGTIPTLGGHSATGTVHGWCGLSVGSGAVTSGGSFSWIGVGGVLVVTGELNGVAHVFPNLLAGDSCLTTGADDFVIHELVADTSCTPPTPTSITVTIPAVPPFTHSGFTGSVHVCIPIP
jgi:hypothetical protein